MGVISEDAIMQILQDYVNSPAGKQLLKERGIRYGCLGAKSGTTQEQIDKIVREVKERFIAAVGQVIGSFRGNGVSVRKEQPDGQGRIKVSINVREDVLHRDSLHYIKSDGTIASGEGVHDIIALFVHGYTLTKRPHGFWVRAEGSAGAGVVAIGALTRRDPNLFLDRLIIALQAQYGAVCDITLNSKYQQGGGE